MQIGTEPDAVAYRRVLERLYELKTATPLVLSQSLAMPLQEVYKCLGKGVRESYFNQMQGNYTWEMSKVPPQNNVIAPVVAQQPTTGPGVEDTNQFYDWMGIGPKLQRCYRLKIPTLLVGPKGTGKTEGILAFARQTGMKLYSVPCSLGLREHQFVGRLDRASDGSITFKEGFLPQSMRDPNGGILYLDELSAAEPDVLVRLDEALDARRELNVDGMTIKADPKWWVVASINPLDHAGTRELPPQLLSRFTARIPIGYPPAIDEELKIIKQRLNLNGSVPQKVMDNITAIVDTIRDLRAQQGDLFYSPSIRESIAVSKMLIDGASPQETVNTIVLGAYEQWGKGVVDKAHDFVVSKLGRNF